MKTVNATVPVAWVPRFIGHKIWIKPTGTAGQSPAQYLDLIDCDLENSQWGTKARAWVRHNGQIKHGLLPRLCTIADLPQHECVEHVLKDGKNEYRQWQWQPPTGEPEPWWPVHNSTWQPTLRTEPAPAEEWALFPI